ncbi:MAG: regulatory protein RecX [Ruminococcaceae bacterium]|nr:regulatory protein RecX [Oscillospiraceae bacterium]
MMMTMISSCVSTVTEVTHNFSKVTANHTPLTITVRSLRSQHEGAEILVGVLLESGGNKEQKNLPLTAEQYYEIKPTKGEISEEMYERLEEASMLCQALRCGEHLLSYGSNSMQTLARKLTQRGYSREVAQSAAARLCDMGLIDEKKDVRREVEKCLKKLWGSKRISAHLWSKGFAQESLEELPEILNEVDFAENCAALIRKHYGEIPNDSDDFRRMTASLARYGYSVGEIKEALKRF